MADLSKIRKGGTDYDLKDSAARASIDAQTRVFHMNGNVDYPVSGIVSYSVAKNFLSNGGIGVKTGDILISTNGTVCEVTAVYSSNVNYKPIGTISGNSEDQIIAILEAYLAENPISGETQYLHIKYSDNGERFTGTLDNLVTDLSRWESGYYGKNKVECAYAICRPDFIPNSKMLYRVQFIREGYRLVVANYSAEELSSLSHSNSFSADPGRDTTFAGEFIKIYLESTDTSATYETIIADIEANGFPIVFGPLSNAGEEPGAYIGLLLDSNEEDSWAVKRYTWIKLGGGDVDLSGYAQKSELPTKVSQLENDSGYLTEHQDISGKLDASELPTAINTALAQAKASGEFDGKPGEKGDPGKTPEKGTDYFTDADKNEMVNAVLSALPTWTGGSY